MSTASAAETTTLGMSDLEFSRIAFGTWQLGGDWGSFDEGEAVKRTTTRPIGASAAILIVPAGVPGPTGATPTE